MAELNFDNAGDLEKWLDTQPQETAVAIAGRASLRSVPFLSDFLRKNTSETRTNHILPLFRAIAVANSARWGIAELATAARSAAHSARSATYAARSATYAADSARSAAYAADSARSAAYAAAYADSATYAADSAAYGAHSAAWQSITADTKTLVVASNASPPLWHGDPPDRIMEHWHALRDALLSAEGEDWAVWTKWYEARLRGDPADIALERAKALIPDEIWKQGPKVANAEIRRLIGQHKGKNRSRKRPLTIEEAVKLVEQDRLGFTVEPSGDHMVLDASDSPLDDRIKQDLPIMRMRADQLCRAFAQANDPYQLDRRDEAAMFAEIVRRPLPEIAENARTLWHLSIGFGSAYERDTEERAKDSTVLTDLQRGTLDTFLASSANFVRLFPDIRDMDSENLLHRNERHRRDLRLKLIEGSVTHRILLDADARILRAIERIAGEATGQSAKAANAADASQSNLLRRVLLFAAGKAGIVSDVILKEMGIDMAENLKLGEHAIAFAKSMKAEFLDHIGTLPADTRGPMRSVIEELDTMDV